MDQNDANSANSSAEISLKPGQGIFAFAAEAARKIFSWESQDSEPPQASSTHLDVVEQLACVPLEKDFGDLVKALNVQGIAEDFKKNYKNLGELKKFRNEYEQQNFMKRWWHNDKLRDAQLDSAEVQAEFSKTIGQLMMISIMQSKKLAEQQGQLNEQQGRLKKQADGIAEHASELQQQQQVQAEQSAKLKTLVHEYFALKGLTEDGAQKLIEIAREVKATKDGMLQEFSARTENVEAMCAGVQSRMESISAQVDERIRLSEEQTQAGIAGIHRETREALATYETSQRAHQEAVQNTLNHGLETLAQSQREAAGELKTQQAAFESRVADLSEKHDHQLAAQQEKLGSIDAAVEGLSVRSTEVANAIAGTKAELSKSVEQQQAHHDAMTAFQQEVSRSLKRLRYVATGLSVVMLGLAGCLVYLIT